MLLKAPVAVGATLLVVGKVLERTPSKGGKTKVKIGASLEDGCSPAPGVAPTVYAEMTGLSIEGVRLPSSVPHDDGERLFLETVAPLLESRCLPCHSSIQAKGGLSFEGDEAERSD